MTLIAIAVVARNRVLGDGHDQPFKFPEDWARFKRVTMGHPMIMGRRTHDLMGFLPGRLSIVVTRHPDLIDFPIGKDGRPRGYAVDSIAKAISLAAAHDEIAYVVGGGEIYRQTMPLVDELDLTEVHTDAQGSVYFPEVDPAQWNEVSRDPHGEFDFVRYERRRQTMRINLAVGDVASFTKTLGESDVYLFAGITGDLSPNHINEEYGRTTAYGGRIAHGLLVLSLASATSTMIQTRAGQACVSYGYDRVRFTAGVLIGDTLTVTYTIDTVDHEQAKTIATIEIRNQRGELCAVATHIMKFFDSPLG